jgi:uncharacterized protein (TIGR03067 family)
MKSIGVVFWVCLFATPQAAVGREAKGGDAGKELARFQGTWVVHKHLSRGADFPVEKEAKVVIEGTTLKGFEDGKLVQTLNFRIDPTKSPSQIDLIPPKGVAKGETVPGIYKFEGDTLTIATGFGREERKTRPKSFEDRTKLFIMILRRAAAPDRKGGDAKKQVILGEAALDREDYDRAIEHFGQAIRLDPGLGVAYYGRALTYLSKKEYDRAIKDCAESIRLVPNDPQPYSLRGFVHMQMKEYGLAVGDLSKAIDLGEEHHKVLVWRGQANHHLGEFERAIQDLTKAIKLRPGSAEAYYWRGESYLRGKKRQDLDRAIADYSEAMRLEPRLRNTCYLGRGFAHSAKRDHKQAVEDFTHALRLDPGNTHILSLRGDAHRAGKDYQSAAGDYLKAVERLPKDHDLLDSVAWFLATCPDPKVRDGGKAVELAKRACDLTDSKRPTYLDTLAAACAECGRFEEAVRWQEAALRSSELPEDQREAARARLRLYKEGRPYRAER